MPRPVQAQGRPGTPVIPAGWAQSHAQVVQRAIATASSVRIGPAGGASHWDEGLGRTVTASAPAVYSGIAELMVVTDTTRALTVVEDPIKQRVYEVTLPYDATGLLEVEHVVFVQAGDPDPMLAGRDLRVAQIERGSRRFSRVLLAILLD